MPRVPSTVRCVAGALLYAGLAACHAAPEAPIDRLFAEMSRLAQDDRLRAAVLRQAAFVEDPRFAEIGRHYVNDPDDWTRMLAYLLAFTDEANAAPLVVRGLASDNQSIVRASAKRAETLPADPEVDRALERVMETEEVALTLVAAFRSYVARRGRIGADRVFQVVGARGDAYRFLAAPALSRYPEPRFADVFTASLHTAYALFGRRGLLALDLAPDPTWREKSLRYGAEVPLDEYSDASEQYNRDLGTPRASSIVEMLREAAQANVVLFAESHHSACGQAWQIALLGQLCALRGGPRNVDVLHESHDVQRILSTAAQTLGCRVVHCEPNRDPANKEWSLEQRDDEAMRTIRANLSEDRLAVVIYGAAHTPVFERHLRGDGNRVVRILLQQWRPMQGAALRLSGTMAITGNVYRYDDGTYFVAALPYTERGCPELDWVLAGGMLDDMPAARVPVGR